uniref:MGA conserved domain-containing protein n=2 Tax=Dendroctonus ponderosae TaxID=77166 RepID=A0AAR5Q2H9_DENPD
MRFNKMDADAIDLTVPLEEILKEANWPAKVLNEEFSLLAENGTGCEKDPDNKNVLEKLLNSYDDIPTKTELISAETELGFKKQQPPVIDTILISDDDEADEVNNGESASVTEVEVEEVSDYSNGCSRGSSSQGEFGTFEVTSSGKISSESVNTSESSWASSQSKKQGNTGTNPQQHAHLIFKGKVIPLPIAECSATTDHWDEPDQSRGLCEGNPSESCDSDLKDCLRPDPVRGNAKNNPLCGGSVMNGSDVEDAFVLSRFQIPDDNDPLRLNGIDCSDLKTFSEESATSCSSSSNAPKELLCEDSSRAKSECDNVSKIIYENSQDSDSEAGPPEKSLKTRNVSIGGNVLHMPISKVTSIADLICDETLAIPDGEYELTPDPLYQLPSRPAKHCFEKSDDIDASAGVKTMPENKETIESEEVAKAVEAEENSVLNRCDPLASRGLTVDLHEHQCAKEKTKRYQEEVSSARSPTDKSTKTSDFQSNMQTAMPLRADKEEPMVGSAGQTSEDETEMPAANPEEIRKRLKLQLSNLRGRKKMNIFQHVQQTVNNNQLSASSTCRGKGSNDSSQSSKVTEDTPSLDLLKKRRSWPVDQEPDCGSTSESAQALDCREDEDVPNVFNEIRKIIRKPKPSPAATVLIKVREVTAINEGFVDAEKPPEAVKPQQSAVQDGIKSEECSNDVVSSPFISNSLDEFLIDAKLNVSYTIPKSGAEEGLIQDYSTVDPLMTPEVKVKEERIQKPKKKTHYKAKTLAEKRKILEKLRSQEERRLRKQKKKMDLENKSYVWFKNKKLFVKSKLKGKCLASINSTIKCDVPDLASPKKLSLLTELNRHKSSVEYRAGPLSKKHLLQSNCPGDWSSELRNLPKVVLHVRPAFGKRVPEHILPQIVRTWDGSLNADQVEFALAALSEQRENTQRTFQFHLSYENDQEKMLVQKKMDKAPLVLCSTDQSSPSDGVSEVAGVVDDLIRYVEVKEMAGDLIKEPEDGGEGAKVESPKEIEWDAMKSPIKAKKRKNNYVGTKRELLRLNCKLVTMEANVSAEPSKVCTKSHCQLGCVCESLRCETIIGIHCRKFACMFSCVCPQRQNAIINISAPTNPDSAYLSRDAVNRIEDEAKKHLAREERDFIQTIIYSNDSAIVLGSGYKSRRVTRAPKKYTDFFEDPIEARLPAIAPCSVSIENLNLSALIPYCMEHRVHDCRCGGHDVHCLRREARLAHSSTMRKRHCKNSLEDDSLFKPVHSRKGRLKVKNEVTVEPPAITQPTAEVVDGQSSARTRPFPPKYRQFLMVNSVQAASGDYINSVSDSEILYLKQCQRDSALSDSDSLKIRLVKGLDKSVAPMVADQELPLPKEARAKPKNKRKQQLEVRRDVDDPPLDSFNEWLAVPSKRVKAMSEPRSDDITAAFPGEIIVKDSTWLKSVCSSAKEPLKSYARILPWPALLAGFLARSINVYFIREMPLRLVMNVGKVLNGKNYFNIERFGSQILDTPLKSNHDWLLKQSDNVRDIIKWLLSGTLSARYAPSTLSFLLVETVPKQFEVRGLCTQSAKPSALDLANPLCSEEKSVSDEISEIKHEDMNNKISSLFITKWNYPLRRLQSRERINEMWAALPDDIDIKWRVVFLKREFAFLMFKKIRYSIKYSDLINLTDIAKEQQLTVMVRNAQIRRNHHQSLFGLYATPKYADRIFIGPYSSDFSEVDIDTLITMNKSLISCEAFYTVKDGKYRRELWLYDGKSNSVGRDLEQNAEASAPEDLVRPKETAPVPNASQNRVGTSLSKEEKIITHNGVKVIIKNSRARTPSEFNRYIITNIPNFGYLGAYQPEGSSLLEVSWPFERKVLQFNSADEARDFLQERFNQLLLAVPETFKIQVIVLISLDLNEYQPINSDVLNGHSICGYLGTYNFRGLTEKFCREKLKVSKQEIVALFEKRAHNFINKKVKDLADAIGVEANDDQYDIESILQLSKSEIMSQGAIRTQCYSKIQKLEKSVSDKIMRVFNLVKDLPAKERNIESKILNEILQIRPRRPASNEVIEIPDDDDDDDEYNIPSPATPTEADASKTIKPKLPADNINPIESEQIILIRSDDEEDSSAMNVASTAISPNEKAMISESTPTAFYNLRLADPLNDHQTANLQHVDANIDNLPIIIDVRTVTETDDESDEGVK